ncbi:methylamine methyltransferase corrinoid protein reductive activase [Methanobacterium sp.]|jgi:methylamine methyltransferase corrinoid protein reductive activase|uniref:methylamine methyltransferase corrinoid protein reductive activase n=1 Tax=Methanobacterium sp. TaxID=2164 RepID=UPI003158A13A
MKTRYGIALDIGTSGIRAQALNIEDGKVISTAITLRHPLPGANVVDHLHFAIKVGRDTAHEILIDTVNKVLNSLNIDLENVERLAVCGNPIQLSLFHNIEIRDLAYWGPHALERLHVTPPSRDAITVNGAEIGLKINQEAEIYIPPAIKHEIGADALAMLFKSQVLEKKGIYLVSDFGTNAEIALVIDGEVYSCSAAAGPAVEGQMIEKGRLASPGTICDLELTDYGWKTRILDDDLIAQDGNTVDPSGGTVILSEESGVKPIGITGTGVIAAYSLGLSTGIIKLPKIKSSDGKINLHEDIYLTERDIENIGKALGAFRAAHLTLAEESGVFLDEIDETYMAGASGFYVDPHKSLNVGQIPPSSREIYQMGNTSLAMAKDLVLDPGLLEKLQKIADGMRSKHITLATSPTFEKIYSLELAMCEQGMPFWMYNDWLTKYGFQKIPPKVSNPVIHRIFERDIPELGEEGLKITKIGGLLKAEFEGCTSCMTCAQNCPEDALTIENGVVTIRTDLCSGMACLRCELGCPQKVFKYEELLTPEKKPETS